MTRGFTLIELVIVLAAIAILAGIAVPRFMGMKDEPGAAKAKGELRAIKIALESYYIHNERSYPPTTPALIDSYLKNAVPRVLGKVLYDPFAAQGAEYNYFCSADGQRYLVLSCGPDRIATLMGIDDSANAVGRIGDDIYLTNGNF